MLLSSLCPHVTKPKSTQLQNFFLSAGELSLSLPLELAQPGDLTPEAAEIMADWDEAC